MILSYLLAVYVPFLPSAGASTAHLLHQLCPSYDLTIIEALIISGRSRARLAPVRLNIRLGIGGIVSKLRVMRASRWY
jgi:hypothetical protein